MEARPAGYDVLIVGAGIVGLATAYQLLRAHRRLRLAVVDKEGTVGVHQTGHNSGVLHAGVYYAPGSKKGELCRRGKAELESFAEAHDIAFQRCGKLIVALNELEVPRLRELERRATANQVPGIEVVGRERIAELEPHSAGILGLWSPTTGVIDYVRVAEALATEIGLLGGDLLVGHEVLKIVDLGSVRMLETQRGPVRARDMIVCAGLQADRLAHMTGTSGPRIVPFRGDYYVLRPESRFLIRGLLYPLPDPAFPFLGVHFTRRIDGEVWAGPNAVLAFAREGYRRRDVNVRDLWSTLAYPGFLRVALRNARMGMGEMWRAYVKRAFTAALARYVPELRSADLLPGPSGVRAQAIDSKGRMIDDFAVGGSAHVLQVQNAPSPAATASLAIGSWLADAASERFGLGADR
ncbi:MAG: L-2-hydroxyglutarate oxidase [Candidatus Limnocylindrales bacterium]|jgi:L-2-hydroxyglutarate oxidase LhgO